MKTFLKCGVLSLASLCALGLSDVRAAEPGARKTAFLFPLFGNCSSTGSCNTVSNCPNGFCGPVAPSYCPPGAACGNAYGVPAPYGNYGGYNGGFGGGYGPYAPVNGGYVGYGGQGSQWAPRYNNYAPAYQVPGYGVGGGYAPVGGGYSAPVVVPAGGYYPAQSGYRGPAARPVYTQPGYGQSRGGFSLDDPFYP